MQLGAVRLLLWAFPIHFSLASLLHSILSPACDFNMSIVKASYGEAALCSQKHHVTE